MRLAWIIVRQGSLGKEDERDHLGNFAVEPSGYLVPPGKAGQQPEASLARLRGNPSGEA